MGRSLFLKLVLLYCLIGFVVAHEDHGAGTCESNEGVRIQANYKPGVVTLDGHADDWAQLDGFDFSLLLLSTQMPTMPTATADWPSKYFFLFLFLNYYYFLLFYFFYFFFLLSSVWKFRTNSVLWLICRRCMMDMTSFSCCNLMGFMHILRVTSFWSIAATIFSCPYYLSKFCGWYTRHSSTFISSGTPPFFGDRSFARLWSRDTAF